MGVASGEQRDPAIISHLLADLTPEALDEWSSASPAGPVRGQPGVHDIVHARLGAVSRSLRRAKPGIPLHAACCTLPDGRGVLIAGRTGAGKSTLCAVLGARTGATMVSDDTIWFDGVRASSIGAPIALRAGSPYWDVAGSLWYADDSSRLLARPEDLGMPSSRTSGPVGLLLLPQYAPDTCDLSRVRPAEAFCHLVGSLLRECAPEEVDVLAELAGRIPAASISYPDVETSVDLCNQFFATAATSTAVVPRRLHEREIQDAGLRRDVQGFRFGDDATMWRPRSGQIVYVSDWPGGPLWETPAEERLTAMGFLERREARRA